jgi:hypothetical protein
MMIHVYYEYCVFNQAEAPASHLTDFVGWFMTKVNHLLTIGQ